MQPKSENGIQDDSGANANSNVSHMMLTRTVAILAGMACTTHRQAIQSIIVQRGFRILAERLEEWSCENDQDFLANFFRDEDNHEDWIQRLTGAPIYVMLLERHRATEVWQEMCGPETEAGNVGEDDLPQERSSLRSRYGINSLYACQPECAVRQAAICFPELAPLESIEALQAEVHIPATQAATSSDGGFLVRENEDIVYDEDGKAFDAHNGEPLLLQEELVVDLRSPGSSNKNEGKTFKARPLPASTKQALNQPRLSRAAALRMGVTLPEPPKRTMSTTSSCDASLGISGLPRAGVAQPKSLMAPAIAPRLNKVAAARTSTSSSLGVTMPTAVTKERKPIDFSNTPGHKRASLSASKPASLAAPSVAPRLNKAAAARFCQKTGSQGREGEDGHSSVCGRSEDVSLSTTSSRKGSGGSPTSVRKAVDFSNTPGHKRMSTTGTGIKSLQAPTLAPRSNRVSEGRTGFNGLTPAKSMPKVVSASRDRDAINGKENKEKRPVDFSNTPGHKRTSTGAFSIAALAQPTIAPRSNAAAMKRLSMGGVGSNVSTATKADPARPRPSSVQASVTSTPHSIMLGSRPGVPTSANPKRRSALPPPSSFRM